jgi:predicted MFS family arabinose efflux permease
MLGIAITLSFVERIGDFRGFAPEQVAGMLVAGGFLALVAPIVAHLMQHRIPLIGVVILGPLFHGALSLAVSNAPVFPVFAACYVLVIPTVIFVHTFMFDLLAKLDASGRSNSATASMMMFGAAAGPFLGGATADIFGYPFVGVLAGAAAVCGGLCFLLARNQGLSNRLREASK